jgi:hypothetical protein
MIGLIEIVNLTFERCKLVAALNAAYGTEHAQAELYTALDCDGQIFRAVMVRHYGELAEGFESPSFRFLWHACRHALRRAKHEQLVAELSGQLRADDHAQRRAESGYAQ